MTEQAKNPVGRPRLYQDAKEFADATDAYFEQAKIDGKLPTKAGLCLHLGFVDKESFNHYDTYGGDFSRTVKRANMRIEDDRHQRLANPACTGIIFDLKANHGWQDKQTLEHTGTDGGPIRMQGTLKIDGETPREVIDWLASQKVED